MELDYYTHEQLRTLLTELMQNHTDLGPEIQQLIKLHGYDMVDVLVFENEIHDLIDPQVSSGFINWARNDLDSQWYRLMERHLVKLKQAGDLLALADYIMFAWRYTYQIMEVSDEDGTLRYLIDFLEQEMVMLNQQINIVQQPKLTRQIVARYMAILQDEVVLSWDVMRWVEQTVGIVTDGDQREQLVQLLVQLQATNLNEREALEIVLRKIQ